MDGGLVLDRGHPDQQVLRVRNTQPCPPPALPPRPTLLCDAAVLLHGAAGPGPSHGPSCPPNAHDCPPLAAARYQGDFVTITHITLVLAVLSSYAWFILLLFPLYLVYYLVVNCFMPWIQEDTSASDNPMESRDPMSRKDRRKEARADKKYEKRGY